MSVLPAIFHYTLITAVFWPSLLSKDGYVGTPLSDAKLGILWLANTKEMQCCMHLPQFSKPTQLSIGSNCCCLKML